jgi:hypothetical protein
MICAAMLCGALLLAPEIAPNIIVIWIGGQEYPFGHPQPWGGISEVEYNLNLDIPAARCASEVWSIPNGAAWADATYRIRPGRRLP